MERRKRILYLFLILITIPLGLGTRSYGPQLPNFIATYGGDVLAATCIFFGVRFVWIRPSLSRISIISYLVCLAIELFQLYQAPWIVNIRNTRIGGILLGHWFVWSDLVCYGVGVVLALMVAFLAESVLFRSDYQRRTSKVNA